MRDRPSGQELTALAHATGGEEALVARCWAIAEREAGLGDVGFEYCRALLKTRYGEASDRALLLRLAAEISAGAFDKPGPTRDWLTRMLREITQQKLRESNPEFLAANGLNGAPARPVKQP
jgi:hypothetical protein